MSRQELKFGRFGDADDPLSALQQLPQGRYLRRYLTDLGAASWLEEPTYFDRDYLSEFKAFYCTSTAGYTNRCRRVHFFRGDVSRESFATALGGDSVAATSLQHAYLGFVVLRPIPSAPIGRTVLRWYDDPAPMLPRVIEPSRQYTCHVAGLKLSVHGLAWQQQDTGVGACATIALWSMLHASAFDDWHIVPTTAEVTQAAHRAGFSVRPLFPTRGLTLPQMEAAVRDWGLTPLVTTGKLAAKPPSSERYFDKEHFSVSLASFIRSGYPVLIAGHLENGAGHAVCGVGFRQATVASPLPGQIVLEDSATQYVYIHDDNLGPAARFEVTSSTDGATVLRLASPSNRPGCALPEVNGQYPGFKPVALLAATHDDVRIAPDELHQHTLRLGKLLAVITSSNVGVSASSRIAQLSSYLDKELGLALSGDAMRLTKARLDLCELVPPMSRHVGIARIGVNASPLVDVLFDTTDSWRNTRAFCHVVYQPDAFAPIQTLQTMGRWPRGILIEAF